MNYYLATYIDLIQSIGSLFIFASVILVLRKFLSDIKKDNYIKAVKIRVDE